MVSRIRHRQNCGTIITNTVGTRLLKTNNGTRLSPIEHDSVRLHSGAVDTPGNTRAPSNLQPPLDFATKEKKRAENSLKKKSPPSLMVPRRHDVSGDSATKNQCKELVVFWNVNSSWEKLGDIHNHMVAKSEINLSTAPRMTSWSLHKLVASIGLC